MDNGHIGIARTLRAKHCGEIIVRNPHAQSVANIQQAAVKVAEAGYPLGFIVAPIYLHDGWQQGYQDMFEKLSDSLPSFATKDLTFELIQHRFTKPAKRVIQQNYPLTKLELDESKRKWKWGKYGIGKYVYTDDEQEDIKDTLGQYINRFFPDAKLDKDHRHPYTILRVNWSKCTKCITLPCLPRACYEALRDG